MGVHFSSSVELQGGKSSPLQLKMKLLIVLLSATLVYGAADPGFGHAYHNGPHCHDKKDYQCHKVPKQQEHEECYVDYDIIVDVTYIEECEYVVITHCKEEQCHKHPKENTRKIPKQTCKKIVDTIYIEEC